MATVLMLQVNVVNDRSNERNSLPSKSRSQSWVITGVKSYRIYRRQRLREEENFRETSCFTAKQLEMILTIKLHFFSLCTQESYKKKTCRKTLGKIERNKTICPLAQGSKPTGKAVCLFASGKLYLSPIQTIFPTSFTSTEDDKLGLVSFCSIFDTLNRFR